MKKEMKVLIAKGGAQGEIVSLPVPAVTENTVLVKVCYCGICGTDQDLFSGQCSFVENGQVTYPLRLGHEWSGVVSAVGEGVTEFKSGNPVVGENAVTCGTCEACLRGDYAHCHHMLNVGTIEPVYDGAFCEYYLIPKHHLHKIPEGISLKAASLSEPLSVAYGGIKRMKITEDSTVAVIGSGCIGNEEDAEKVLGFKPENTEITKGQLDIEAYKQVFVALKERFGFKYIGSTLRESRSASDNGWSAMIYDGNEFYHSRSYDIHLVDRGGGGASFAAGMIYGLLNGMSLADTCEFATAASALKQTITGDFNLATLDEVKKLMGGDASGRVSR